MPELKKVQLPWIPKKKKQTKSWNTDPRYHTTRWRKYRESFFKKTENKFCVECRKVNKLKIADTVGHIIPVSKDSSDENFWNPGNHKPLCRSCNARETNNK